MGRYLFGTGILGVITGALPLLRALRGDAPFTWRVALAWVGWVITATLAIGAVVDLRNAETGQKVVPRLAVRGSGAQAVAKRQKRISRR